MLLECLPGFNEIFTTEPPTNSIILITGEPGTLKSTLTYNLLWSMVKDNPQKKCVYIGIEETKESYKRSIESIGLSFLDEQIYMCDVASFKASINHKDFVFDEMDYIDFIFHLVNTQRSIDRDSSEVIALALDSLNAFELMLTDDRKNFRRRIEKLFYSLRERGITSFITLEDSSDEFREIRYMVDGIFELGITETRNDMKRYLQVRKMRASNHSIAPFLLEVGERGISVKGRLMK